MAASAASPPLTSPRIYLIRMVVFLTLAGFLAFVLYRQIVPAFMANPGLNGLILGATLIAILMAFGQVQRLFREVRFANRTVTGAADPGTPLVLSALAPALQEARAGRPQPQAQFQPLLDSVASRLDEGREILRYIGGLLILLGLLGTFWGLLDTVSSIGNVIKSLRTGAEAGVLFDELKAGLAAPLAGMGLSFSSSLFGIAGSLILGFLELQVAQAQRRFRNEVESWLGTRIASAPLAGPGLQPLTGDPLADRLDRLGAAMTESGANNRAATQALASLAEGIQGLVQHMRSEQQLIRDWVEAQASREKDLKRLLERLTADNVMEP